MTPSSGGRAPEHGAPGAAMCSVCLCPGRRRRGLGRRRGGGWRGGRRLSRRGFLSWGRSRRGIPASNFLSPLRLGCCPPAPSPPRGAGGPAPAVCKSWGNSPLFPSKGIFPQSLGPAQADLFTWVAQLSPALCPRAGATELESPTPWHISPVSLARLGALTFWADGTAVAAGGCLVFLCQQSFFPGSDRDPVGGHIPALEGQHPGLDGCCVPLLLRVRLLTA